MNTITNTIAVVTPVSLRLGQVTRETSWRTCWKNSTGLVFAMNLIHYPKGIWPLTRADSRKLGSNDQMPLKNWQEWRGSNPQPPVLETGALAD